MLWEETHRDPMPRPPVDPDVKSMTVQLRPELTEHLDQQAFYLGISRAAYLRQLVMEDIRHDPIKEWPDQVGMTYMTVRMRNDTARRMDEKAEYLGMRRVSYLRQLVIKDMKRQGPPVVKV
jgi:predicted transcriptional regulator